MRLNLTALVTTLAIAQGTVGLPVVAQLDVVRFNAKPVIFPFLLFSIILSSWYIDKSTISHHEEVSIRGVFGVAKREKKRKKKSRIITIENFKATKN